ncbi:MAG: DUF2799 domain-containing protein [Burkholderiales bacterium]|nr:DUF2799 domain-containing protein [Burkholderiales bacterium]
MKTIPRIYRLTLNSLALAACALLSACQTTMSHVSDCKAGDWVAIGSKDGADGLDKRYDERKRFCSLIDGDKIKTVSSANYDAGWVQGNLQYWTRLGHEDGRSARPLAYFETQANSGAVAENHTPLNRPAYEQGWQAGNGEYWYQLGEQDGRAGMSAGQESVRAGAGAAIGYNAESYRQGWRNGNYEYWVQLGYQDAHDGIPDGELLKRVRSAQAAGLQVREDGYHAGWNREIIEYWKNLGWSDATAGRDIHTRRDDAKKRGLKLAEAEYQQQWEKRLIEYWRDAGNSDGDGHPDRMEERMANARRDNVFVIAQTRDLYQQAWTRQNASYCSIDRAFAWGREHRSMAMEVCSAALQSRLQHAWISGQDFEELAAKLQNTHAELLALSERHSDAGRRLDRLERDLRHDQDDKNRPNNSENSNLDRKRERERQELREFLQHTRRRIDDMRSWEFRYEQQMQQIRRDIYL